jgi:membrane protein DedA with SNARE-associated domain
VLADILSPLVDAATNVINALGLPGVFVLMTAESACIPIPSEAIMLFAGFNVSQGNMTLFGIVAAGVLGNLVGSLIAYGVGYYGRIELLDRNRLIHINRRHLEQADRWFERHGSATVFFTRMLPIVRTFISLPAGAARMPLGRFAAFTFLGSIPWVLMLAIVGREVGSRWDQWRDHLHYLDYAILAAIVVAIVYLIVRRRRSAAQLKTAGAGDSDRAET